MIETATSPLSSPRIPVAVVVACSKLKRRIPDEPASREELLDPGQSWRRLDRYAAPAREMYQGRAFKGMIEAVDGLRMARPDLDLSLYIVSAGYGLLRERDRIVPYEASLGPRKRDWVLLGRLLEIPDRVQRVLGGARVSIVVLSEPYLGAAALPCRTPHDACVVYLASGNHRAPEGSMVFRAGRRTARALATSEREVGRVVLQRLLALIEINGPAIVGELSQDPAVWTTVAH